MSAAKFKIESGMQLLARLTRKSEISNFCPHLFEICPEKGDFIEIACESGTPLLIDIISEALLTHTLQKKETGIIHVNTDGNFNYNLLLNVTRKKILSHSVDRENVITDLNMEEKLYEILNNFHILEVNDATQLYTTLYNLENTLMEQTNISLLIFDTLTAFYWSEQGFKITKMDSYMKNLLQLIKKVTKEYKVICIYTKPLYFNSNKDVDHTESWIPETLKYRIEVNMYEKSFLVNVKTNEKENIKTFQVTSDEIKWL